MNRMSNFQYKYSNKKAIKIMQGTKYPVNVK